MGQSDWQLGNWHAEKHHGELRWICDFNRKDNRKKMLIQGGVVWVALKNDKMRENMGMFKDN